MAITSAESNPAFRPLDDALYKMDEQQLEFMKKQTGIQDPEELKKHIIGVQEEAYAVSSHCDSRCFSEVEWNGSADLSVSVYSSLRIRPVSTTYDVCMNFAVHRVVA